MDSSASLDDDSDDVISEATRDLRDHALISYVELMERPTVLPDLLVKLICWVVGEYLAVEDGREGGDGGGGCGGTAGGYDVKSIVEKMVEMLYRPYQCEF